MKRLSMTLLVSLALLSGCDQVQSAYDKYIKPSTATLNGYTVGRGANGAPTGEVDLNVSALDGSGEPIAGEITNPVATVKVVPPSGAVTPAQVLHGNR